MVPQPSSIPLFVVAGLPKSTEVGVEALIRSAHPKPCAVVRLAAASGDGAIYRRQYVESLLSVVATFAKKRRKDATASPATPGSIRLLYVPAPDEEDLLSAFDFAVMPVPLTELGSRNERGMLLRHDPTALGVAISRVSTQLTVSAEMFNRVKRIGKRDPITLPPKNFHLGDSRKMATLFREMRKGLRPWTDRFPELVAEQFDRDSLEPLSGESTQYSFRDGRGVIFFQPPASEFHGGNWTEDVVDAETATSVLRKMYRFGAPLPPGFQHDAQREKGTKLKGEMFDCEQSGRVEVSGSHANIYPNDYVRAAGLKSQKFKPPT